MPQNTSPSRHLRPEEIALIAKMLEQYGPKPELAKRSSDYEVQDMNDGGMGSVRFLSPRTERKFGMQIAEAEYSDQDGVLVSITINTDEQGELYEVDFWKMDSSPLMRYPAPNELRMVE